MDRSSPSELYPRSRASRIAPMRHHRRNPQSAKSSSVKENLACRRLLLLSRNKLQRRTTDQNVIGITQLLRGDHRLASNSQLVSRQSRLIAGIRVSSEKKSSPLAK